MVTFGHAAHVPGRSVSRPSRGACQAPVPVHTQRSRRAPEGAAEAAAPPAPAPFSGCSVAPRAPAVLTCPLLCRRPLWGGAPGGRGQGWFGPGTAGGATAGAHPARRAGGAPTSETDCCAHCPFLRRCLPEMCRMKHRQRAGWKPQRMFSCCGSCCVPVARDRTGVERLEEYHRGVLCIPIKITLLCGVTTLWFCSCPTGRSSVPSVALFSSLGD